MSAEAAVREGSTVEELAALLSGRPFAVLTGAGCSTASGIPDYRGPGTRARARRPVQYREFMESSAMRARYWARSMHGWPRIAAALPNPAHRALAALERGGHLAGLLTQNVDRLHLLAGSSRAIELHGALAEVVCTACGATIARSELQERLLADNPGCAPSDFGLAPDGDADVLVPADFRVPACQSSPRDLEAGAACGGVLKPNVVFFGESVPRSRVDEAFAVVEAAGALLVAGSSLAVYSGLRFARRAAERGLPVAIMNLGTTRADEMASWRAEIEVGAGLSRLAQLLS